MFIGLEVRHFAKIRASSLAQGKPAHFQAEVEAKYKYAKVDFHVSGKGRSGPWKGALS